MTFFSNSMEWAPGSICDLYKGRWGIEVFFKQLKQGLQLADFLGHNESAMHWQVWTALLAKNQSMGNAKWPEQKHRPEKLRNTMRQPVPRLLWDDCGSGFRMEEHQG